MAGVGLYDMVETSFILIGGGFFVLVSLRNAFCFQSLAPVSKSDVCVYVGVCMICLILCSEVIQNGCVLK